MVVVSYLTTRTSWYSINGSVSLTACKGGFNISKYYICFFFFFAGSS